jgi:hypothetical protein
LNTYSVRLNKQELFNAEYLGHFKQAAYKMGYKYVTYWKESKILSEQQIARMGEAEFASDLLVIFIDGIQSNKQIEKYYKQFENEDKDKAVASSESKFDKTMSIIGEMYRPEDIANTNFRRIQLFYSLFGSVAHSLFGLKNLKSDSKIPNIKYNIKKIRVLLDDLSSKYDSENKTKDIEELVDAARRGTTDISKRIRRSEIINKFIIKGL